MSSPTHHLDWLWSVLTHTHSTTSTSSSTPSSSSSTHFSRHQALAWLCNFAVLLLISTAAQTNLPAVSTTSSYPSGPPPPSPSLVSPSSSSSSSVSSAPRSPPPPSFVSSGSVTSTPTSVLSPLNSSSASSPSSGSLTSNSTPTTSIFSPLNSSSGSLTSNSPPLTTSVFSSAPASLSSSGSLTSNSPLTTSIFSSAPNFTSISLSAPSSPSSTSAFKSSSASTTFSNSASSTFFSSSSSMGELEVVRLVLAGAILVFWAGFWMVHLIGIIYGYRRLHRRRGVEGAGGEKGAMGVSILKPLVGNPMDPNLMTNLETFFTMQYPKYELLFCIQEEGDPSIMVVQQLMKKHPHVDASFFVGGKEVGVNPKINNMQPGYMAAKHELLLVSDSGVMMKEDTLSDMVAHMTPDVGIVHQMPFCCDRKGWPAILEKVYFGTSHARMYLFLGLLDALRLRVNCCTGMSCLMRKKVLDEAGGISAFGIYLAEDYFFAKFIQDRGWGIRIASQPAWQNTGTCRVKTFLSRLTRWCKLRVAMVPHTILLEPVSECMVLGLVASWAGTVLLRADYLTFFLFHTLTWSLADWVMLNIVQNGPPPFTKFEFVISWLFREVSALFIFLHALWNPVISWRDGSFKLRWFGVAEPINSRVVV